jgi:hypothetical protein
MIPRYQRILFWTLALASLIMAMVLARGCEQAHKRLSAMQDQSPIAAPVDAPQEPVSVAIANDNDASIAIEQRLIALPRDPALRARALLERIFSDYAQPNSPHPLPGGLAVTDVFFLDLPPAPAGQLPAAKISVAVVNLSGAFASHHPSGIEAEELTLRSIVGTLHLNFPDVAQIRFLVDGHAADTLAGHSDLSRPYPAINTVEYPLHVLAPNGSRE